MFKEKPVLSNQHGALVMAFVPFLYAMWLGGWVADHLWLGLAWLFTYFFSYPFFALFAKKPHAKYRKWALIYALLALLFALPLLFTQPQILQFLLPILPLVAVQIYYAKRKDERHLLNDIAGILTFGVVGMAAYYAATAQYHLAVLLHPSLFFIATTLYVKSVARERKNPRYRQLSLAMHAICVLVYALSGNYGIALAYLVGFVRAAIVPKQKLSIKQVGMLEFVVVAVFLGGVMIDHS